MTEASEPQHQWLDPRNLPTQLRRYLADLLIGHLRDDRWDERVDDSYLPIRAPGEAPAYKTLGKGYPSSHTASHVLAFTAPPVYELQINSKHLVALDAVVYSRWCSREVSRHLPHIDRLINPLQTHGSTRVYYPELAGYGTAKTLKMRRSKLVSREAAEAAENLLYVCQVAKLG